MIVKIRKIYRYFSNKLLYRYLIHNIYAVRQLTATPIIVCGCPRSGTSLLISILDSHPDIHVIPFETAVLNFRSKKKRLFKLDTLHYLFCRFQIAAYLFSTKIKDSANRWCEKTPFNIFNIDEINRIYKGNVKFINLIRDGRDVVSSRHRRLGYIASPETWYRSVQEAKKYESSENFISVRYEALTTNPAAELLKIKRYLDLKTDFDLENWTKKSSINVNLKKSILTGREMPFEVRDIKPNSIGNWQRSESPHIAEFLNSPELMRLNRELGYT